MLLGAELIVAYSSICRIFANWRNISAVWANNPFRRVHVVFLAAYHLARQFWFVPNSGYIAVRGADRMADPQLANPSRLCETLSRFKVSASNSARYSSYLREATDRLEPSKPRRASRASVAMRKVETSAFAMSI